MKKIFILAFILLPLVSSAAGSIDLNAATLQQLDELAGIGPTYAQRIVDSRPYSSLDDLLRVKGIGEKTLQKIKDQGLAYVKNPNDQIANPNQTKNPNGQKVMDATITTATTYPNGIFINEILPNPDGADETNEWIELYNSNNFDVDLSGWQIQDTAGTIKIYTIPHDLGDTTKILADGFLVFKRSNTKIMLNNDQDGLILLTPDKKIADSINFVSAPLGQSYNKIGSMWQWSSTLTFEAKNIITATTKNFSTNSGPNGLSKAKNSVKNDGVVLGLADISQGLNTNQAGRTTNPWFLFFTVLATTVILAAAILFIKLKFSKVKS